ncbi:MAG: hypothetical protein ABIN94_18635 [Ferruginibacter sp.]
MMVSGKIGIALFIVCALSSPVCAQQFKHTAALEEVKATGFYTINIAPQLSAYTKTDFADIRLANSKKQWVPHLLKMAAPAQTEDAFIQLPIIQNTQTDSGKNLLIIQNTKTGGLYSIQLSLKNTAVNRTAVVSGSNDQHNWYIIDDNVIISKSNELQHDEYLQEINFPMANYRYFKIIIDNHRNYPLLITGAGYYSKTATGTQLFLQENPAPSFSQNDSNNRSYIEVKQDALYQFDRVSLSISGAKFYSRDIAFYVSGSANIKSMKQPISLGNFKLNSAAPSVFELPRTKATHLSIIIFNGDNPPLKIEHAGLQQQIVSLVAYLEKGKKYDLVFGDSLASFPDYDLQLFKDSIHMLQPLGYGKIMSSKMNTTNKSSSGKNTWIWASIILAGIVLTLSTMRLMRDLEKNKSK